MESEKILMAAGVTVAAVVGAFVFWGPSGSRLRQRRGQIAGLHNFGRTCFLNTLLQALAACPQFIAWLQLYNGATPDRKSLISSMLSTLEVINGTHATLRGDPHSPGAVLRALNTLGWVIPQEEHDAHELFHVLLSSLEEEATRPQQMGCLSDALLPTGLTTASEAASNDFNDTGAMTPLAYRNVPAVGQRIGDQPNRPSSAMLSDFLNMEYDESTNLQRLVRSEAHTPDSPASVCERESADILTPTGATASFSGHSPFGYQSAVAAMDFINPQLPLNGSPILGGERLSRPRQPQSQQSQLQHIDGLNRRVSSSCRSLERLNRGPGRVSIWSSMMPSQVAHPFQGAMGAQIVCNGCGSKSAVRYDKFDSVTLNLPEQRRSGLSLGHLLSEYITSEDLSDVKCDSCNETTMHTKSVTFAKLPACLCIHIARTIWLNTGQLCKRQDYVHFPESLSMAPYSFVQPHLNSQAGTPWGSTMSLYSSSLPMNNGGGAGGECFGTMFPKNLYRLLAVVVHSGEANSGHFVTYRRGSLRNAHRWFYTSDTIVREVSIDEVLSVPAYLLFYDRGQQRGQQMQMR
ncbi:ubiquitin carboxyl-terminal hydrolase 30 homolog [Drosophila grimshawi]|uniref:ubiquitinyl hydrolase 1 n=1 Tax=Drosophila grimshawi TaxID=7222 RepID=B4JMJ6_DROGR|nr:ubiquitin carboxyl-terminal hydrolase 30 homolog [Drosophila grimshawi]EDV91939.1 GH24315 [Drosophila grimshawi]